MGVLDQGRAALGGSWRRSQPGWMPPRGSENLPVFSPQPRGGWTDSKEPLVPGEPDAIYEVTLWLELSGLTWTQEGS